MTGADPGSWKVMLMQPLPAVAGAWLRAQGALVVERWTCDDWTAHAANTDAIIYYSIPIDAALLSHFPNLKVIGKRGAGVDTVDLDEVERRRILLTNAEGGNAFTVAEHAVALLLACARDLRGRDSFTRAGRFSERASRSLVREITGSRVGLVGLGHIGRTVARSLSAGFSCDIAYYDPFVDMASLDVDFQLHWRAPSIDALFNWAENVVVAASLTPSSRGMIGRGALELLGPESIVVIVSRGGIVDEDALVQSLRDGTIRGAGVDVYSDEPPAADHPLFSVENAILTPHLAGASTKSRERTSLQVAEYVWALLNGGRAPLVGEQPWLRARGRG